MTPPADITDDGVRRDPTGHGDFVLPAYWVAAAMLVVATAAQVTIGRPVATAIAAALFIAGGLPHGAYDIALLRRAVALDRHGMVLAVAGYVAIAAVMAGLWIVAPLVALIVFLAVAAVHFGGDWPMLEEPLLRVAAGAAVIAAPTIGHRAEVSALFVAMSEPRAAVIAQIVAASAPVALLVTAVGIAMAWRQGSRRWPAAMALCLLLLLVLPPVAGFALFFVFLHSPRHLAETRGLLSDMSRLRWLVTGVSLSATAMLGWWGSQQMAGSHADPSLVAQAFQLLAAVAVPHLVLTQWLDRRLGSPILAGG